ncbi:ABC transporter permease [Nibricoccus sp. IMCC34717]|uniref:ABC transporter permease n=1 Tax=Nibricoccus sp. IMCC34717 TaxID=3034021 RepID=UPI00384CE7B4
MKRLLPRLLAQAPLLLWLAVAAWFSLASDRFLTVGNLVSIVTQASSTGVLAVGMTLVLVLGGVDLSVGALMFVAAALAGKLVLGGYSLALAIPVTLLLALAWGGAIGGIVVRWRVASFIVTLALLFVGRGLGLYLTETRAMNLPDSVLRLGSMPLLGVPFPAWLLAVVVVAGHVFLSSHPVGRQLLAAGSDPAGARKAGLDVDRLRRLAFILCSVCAAIATWITLGQLGAVSPKFGESKEFAAIAAAVIGGTSLQGGRATVFPGVLLGSLLVQTIENGMVVANADPYLYPIVTSAVILVAVALDTLRTRLN